MKNGPTRARLGRTVLAVLLGYVLASQLLLVGLAGSAQAARALAVAPDGPEGIHALCAPDPSLDRRPDPAAPMRAHDAACCTLACQDGSALTPPHADIVEQPAPRPTLLATTPSVDLGSRPATAPPGRGRGPRAPPSALT